MELSDLFMRDDRAWARTREVRVWDDAACWYRFGAERTRPLDALPVILMRKDPPFDMEYIYATYLLEQVQPRGAWVVNDPRSLRDVNEKVFTVRFPQCCPPILITRRKADIAELLAWYGQIILKPLDGMGGPLHLPGQDRGSQFQRDRRDPDQARDPVLHGPAVHS